MPSPLPLSPHTQWMLMICILDQLHHMFAFHTPHLWQWPHSTHCCVTLSHGHPSGANYWLLELYVMLLRCTAFDHETYITVVPIVLVQERAWPIVCASFSWELEFVNCFDNSWAAADGRKWSRTRCMCLLYSCKYNMHTGVKLDKRIKDNAPIYSGTHTYTLGLGVHYGRNYYHECTWVHNSY